jgi:hypothetical protein
MYLSALPACNMSHDLVGLPYWRFLVVACWHMLRGTACCSAPCDANFAVCPPALLLLVCCPVQGAEVAVFAATDPSFTADKPVPLLLHDCKPQQASVSTHVLNLRCCSRYPCCILFTDRSNTCLAKVVRWSTVGNMPYALQHRLGPERDRPLCFESLSPVVEEWVGLCGYLGCVAQGSVV